MFNGSTVFRSSIAFAFITVLDVPDLDPQFIRLPYTASVEEGSPLVSAANSTTVKIVMVWIRAPRKKSWIDFDVVIGEDNVKLKEM